jgi:eukaryotic-like serine/threonine-protein kinase
VAVAATAATVAAPNVMAKVDAGVATVGTNVGANVSANVSANVKPIVTPSTVAKASSPFAPPAVAPVSALPVKATPKVVEVITAQAPKESPRDKRAREAKERAGKPTTAAPAPALASGTVRLAVSPWGQVEVDGKPMGTTPPLNELTLTEGKHQVTIRNDDFPAHNTTVTVTPGQSTSVRHKFGS